MSSEFLTCPICVSGNAARKSISGDKEEVTCTRCGAYSISRTAAAVLSAQPRTARQCTNASSWLFERPGTLITSDLIDLLSSIEAPAVAERASKLISFLSRRFPKIGSSFGMRNGHPEMQKWAAASWSEDETEISYLVRQFLMNEMGWLEFADANLSTYLITAKGYAHLRDLLVKPVDSKIGFCAMWFDPSVQPVWVDAIKPAIEGAGYESKRIDSHEHNNRIDDEIIAMIRRSKFIVADFTGQRGGVYFEAGLALGLNLDVVWTCSKEELEAGKIHFDNRQYSFVTWELDKLDDFKQRLQNRIEATIGRAN